MVYYWDKKLKKMACPGSWYHKKIFDVFSSKDAFLQDMFQMITIALIFVMNYCPVRVIEKWLHILKFF